MTSQNSLNKMIKEFTRHNIWAVILSCIGNIMAGPVFFFFQLSFSGRLTSDWFVNSSTGRMNAYIASRSINQNAFSLIAYLGAIIVAFGIFEYLFSKSKTDLYHSLPISRKNIFFSGYLTGALIWFIPYLISRFIVFIMSLFYVKNIGFMVGQIPNQLLSGLQITICFLAMYTFCIMCIVLSGNAYNAILNIAALGGCPLLIFSLIESLMIESFDTYLFFDVSKFLLALSPFTSISLMNNSTYNTSILLIVEILLLILTFAFIAFRFFNKRKSEVAGNGSINKRFSLVVRSLISICVGLFGALTFETLGLDWANAWVLFGAIFFSMFVYAFTYTIQTNYFKGLLKEKMALFIVPLITALITISITADIFGYDTYIPSRNNIEGMSLYVPDLTAQIYPNYNIYDQEDFDEKIASSYIEDTDLIYDLLSSFVANSDDGIYYEVAYVKVYLKNGSSYTRQYKMDLDDFELIRRLSDNDEFIKGSYAPGIYSDFSKYQSPIIRVSGPSPTIYNFSDPVVFDKIIKAYQKDLEAHRDINELYTGVSRLNMEIDDMYSEILNVYIPTNFTNTINELTAYHPELLSFVEEQNYSSVRVAINVEPELTLSDYFSKNHKELLAALNSEDYEFSKNTDYSWHNYDCELSGYLLDKFRPYFLVGELYDKINIDRYAYIGEIYTDNYYQNVFLDRYTTPQNVVDDLTELLGEQGLQFEQY